MWSRRKSAELLARILFDLIHSYICHLVSAGWEPNGYELNLFFAQHRPEIVSKPGKGHLWRYIIIHSTSIKIYKHIFHIYIYCFMDFMVLNFQETSSVAMHLGPWACIQSSLEAVRIHHWATSNVHNPCNDEGSDKTQDSKESIPIPAKVPQRTRG